MKRQVGAPDPGPSPSSSLGLDGGGFEQPTSTAIDPVSSPLTTPAASSGTSTTASSLPSATATQSPGPTSSESSSKNVGAIVGGTVGGALGLLLLGLVAFWFLRRRKKRRGHAEKSGSTEPVSYTTLNSSFSGVPFGQEMQCTMNNATSVRPRSRGSSPRNSAAVTDRFLPAQHADSQVDTSSGKRSLRRLDIDQGVISTQRSDGHGSNQDDNIAPVSSDPLGEAYMGRSPITIPPKAQVFESNGKTTIIAPRPRHFISDQFSLQHVINQEELSDLDAQQDSIANGSSRAPREHSVSPVSDMGGMGRASPVSLLDIHGVGVHRGISQRTVSSIGSNFPVTVSNEVIERLGVGPPTESTAQSRREPSK